MVEEAMKKYKTAFEKMKTNLIHSGLDEQSAAQKAYSEILPQLQNELWTKQLKNDPLHKRILQTKDAFVNDDNFDAEEAIQAAVDRRKFLIKITPLQRTAMMKIIKDQNSQHVSVN